MSEKIVVDTSKYEFKVTLELYGVTVVLEHDDTVEWLVGVLQDSLEMKGKNRGKVTFEYESE